MSNYYSVTFIAEYFYVCTTVDAEDEDQAEINAEAWLKEQGIDISAHRINEVNVEHEGSY